LVAGFKPGTPLFRDHSEKVIGTIRSVSLRERDDGEWELIGEFDVDLPADEALETFLGRALSIAFTESDPAGGKQAITIGLDSIAFNAEDFEELRGELAELHEVRVAPYHQFAYVPPPAILVDLASNIVPILQGAAGSALWAALIVGVSRFVGRKRAKMQSLRFKLKGPDGLLVQAELPANPKDAAATVEAIFDGATKILHDAGEDPPQDRGRDKAPRRTTRRRRAVGPKRKTDP
jgi:hypothetical protein